VFSQKTLDKDSNLISPSTRAVIARRPTEEEIEKMANRFDNGRLSGDAGQLKTNLHSGEIVYNKVCLILPEVFYKKRISSYYGKEKNII
jgi:hypothetical protein